MHWPCIDHVDFSLNLLKCAQLFQLGPLVTLKSMSNRKLRQSPILDLVSTNIELGLDIGPIHFYLEACKSISSKDHCSDITNKLPSFHKFLNLDLCDLQIQNLCSMLKSVVRFIHPQAMVFLATTVQETQFWILKQNGHQSAMV
jgi:hypothetical protein